MAAYGALTSLLQTLDHILRHNLQLTLNPQKLGSLREKVSFLQHFLQNCCMKTRTNRESMQEFEKKIRDVTFRTEDLIAEVIYQVHLYETTNLFDLIFSSRPVFPLILTSVLLLAFDLIFWSQGHHLPFALILVPSSVLGTLIILFCVIGILEWLSAWPLFIKKWLVNIFLRNGNKDHWVLNGIFEKIKLIAEEATAVIAGGANDAQLPLINLPSPAASSSSRYSRINGVGKDTVVGMDHDLNTIKEMLGYGPAALQIVPIVGMGGIGKTTLAMLVYKDAFICNQFALCAWTTVSQDYCFHRIIQDLQNSANLPKMQGESNDGELGDHLYTNLLGRRYLIVLDDVWDVEIWDDVRRFLPHENNGSCVLLTTRSSNVAHCANSHGPHHHMRFLEENDSQRLLHGQVFGEEDCSDELKLLRDEIAQSCKGLPLALVVVGGLLSKIDRNQHSWRCFADSLLRASNRDDDDECMEILALSYNHMPHRLRPCFLYMGMFPEDYAVPVNKLIQLWIGEGFLQPDTCKSPEELGEEYLEELVGRNLILVGSWSSRGKIKTCNIHDILRKLCIHEAQKEKFLVVVNHNNNVSEKEVECYRRLSIHPNILKTHPFIMYGKKHGKSKVHSLLCLDNNLNSPGHNYIHYRPLRVLDLLALHFPAFPLEVTKLVSLRYLAMSFTGPIHRYISRLQNLQIIVHRNIFSKEIFSLPVEIWLISNLRHVHVPPTLLSTLPNGSNTLSLQTLMEVINLSFDVDIVDKIKSIKKLWISYEVEQESFKGWFEHKLENLAHLEYLEKLQLKVINLSGSSYPWNLAFPITLKKLTLISCRLPWERLIIVGALPNLEVLKLKRNACQGAKWEPVEGQFGELVELELEHLNIVHLKADQAHFPRLHCLTIHSCHQLEEIPLGLRDIPTLERIKLVNCHPGIVSSVKSTQEDQERNRGRSDLKVSVSYNYQVVTGVHE